jgi:hypothetical protein
MRRTTRRNAFHEADFHSVFYSCLRSIYMGYSPEFHKFISTRRRTGLAALQQPQWRQCGPIELF